MNNNNNNHLWFVVTNIVFIFQSSPTISPLSTHDGGWSPHIPGECPHLLQEEPQLVPQVQAQEQEGCAGALDGGEDRVIYNIYRLIIALFEEQFFFMFVLQFCKIVSRNE